ncbi:MAG: aldehyde dehydrogenase [Hyphomonadaceae bacterium]|nr:aldehyde dehydrogenase [Hyphomonadaceae bacterium]
MAATAVPLQHPNHFYINGAWVEPSSQAQIDVIAPATEELFFRVAAAQVEDVNRAVAAARDAFDNGPWSRMSHKDRAGYMNALASELTKRAADIATIWPNEMGILHSVASAVAPGAGGFFQYYAGLADTFAWEEEHKTATGAKLGLLVREPVGVVGAIVPWNGPIMIAAFKIAPALIAGCTVVLKASPEAPGHALLLAEAAAAAGLPPGVLNVVTADREASEALVRNPQVDKVTFTGSTATGRRIAAIMGERIGRYSLELGGKSAAIVLDDCNIEQAAKTLAARGCDMTGQVCAALTRIIVLRDRQAEFTDALAAAASAVKVGDPFDAATQMGPVATRRQRERVEGYIAKGRDEGYKVVAGGGRPKHLERGFFVEPTVFANVDNRSTIAQEEIFGPVLAVIPADNEEHAIKLANDSIYGLNGAVFTDDADRAYRVARRMRTGTVGHSGHLTDFTIAFGGFKQSGIGREGGVEGLHPFLETKTIILRDRPSHLPSK